MQLVRDDEQTQLMPIAIYLIMFEACMNIVFIIKAKILMLLK